MHSFKIVSFFFIFGAGCSLFNNGMKSDGSWEESNKLSSDQNLDSEGKTAFFPSVKDLNSENTDFFKKKHFKRSDFLDRSESEGSLWASNGQTNYYFLKNKYHSSGDLIKLMVNKDLIEEIRYELKKGLKKDEIEKELLKLAQNESHKNEALSSKKVDSNLGSKNEIKNEKDKAVEKSGELKNSKVSFNVGDIDISTSLNLQEGDLMNGEVINTFFNGTCQVRFSKKIVYKNGLSRMVTVVAYIKNSDINIDTDVVDSKNLYEKVTKVYI